MWFWSDYLKAQSAFFEITQLVSIGSKIESYQEYYGIFLSIYFLYLSFLGS